MGVSGVVAETERLSLRRMHEDDAEFVLGLLNEPAFLHFIGDREIRSREDARTYIANVFAPSYEANGYGVYRVGLKETDQPVGMCGLIKREALSDVDVGFAFLQRFWGRGYASEAAAAVLRHAREELRITKILGLTAPDNVASMAVLQRIGLAPAGTVKLPGYEIDRRLFVWEEPSPPAS